MLGFHIFAPGVRENTKLGHVMMRKSGVISGLSQNGPFLLLVRQEKAFDDPNKGR